MYLCLIRRIHLSILVQIVLSLGSLLLASNGRETSSCDGLLKIKEGYVSVSSTSAANQVSSIEHPSLGGSNEAWTANTIDTSAWISFSFKTIARISAIALKGDPSFVKTAITYRTDPVLERDWRKFETEFTNDFDGSTEVRLALPLLPVSLIRLHFQHANDQPVGFNVDLYGCQETSYECPQTFGLSQGGGDVIGDGLVKLNGPPWCVPEGADHFIRISLGHVRRQIDGFTAAGSDADYVAKFSVRVLVEMKMHVLRYNDGELMIFANDGPSPPTRHDLMYSVYTSEIRLDFIEFQGTPCITVELLTSARPCSDCPTAVGISNATLFPDNRFASWSLRYGSQPFPGRLGLPGPGLVIPKGDTDLLEMTLGVSILLVEIETQGNEMETTPIGPTAFTLEFKHKSEWIDYKEHGQIRRFRGDSSASARVRHRLLDPTIVNTIRLLSEVSSVRDQSLKIELYTCSGSFMDDHEFAFSSFDQSNSKRRVVQSPNSETRDLHSSMEGNGLMSLGSKSIVFDRGADRLCLFHPLGCPKGMAINFWYKGVVASHLGVVDGRLPDHHISVSSTRRIHCMSFYARNLLLEPFENEYGWCPEGTDNAPFYQVDFGKETRVTNVIVRSNGIFTFTIQHKDEEDQWINYENGEDCNCFEFLKSTPYTVFELSHIIKTKQIRILPSRSTTTMYFEFLGEEGLLADCSELFKRGYRHSNLYAVSPDGSHGSLFHVFCNFDDSSGGWMVIQRRLDGAIDFRRSWTDYKEGFGSMKDSFYIGNDKLNLLTSGLSELLVDMRTEDGKRYTCWYRDFYVGNEDSGYRLSIGASQQRHAHCNDLLDNDGEQFSTFDVDNDGASTVQCAASNAGGWWYHRRCSDVNLNGVFESLTEDQSIKWKSVTSMGSRIVFVEMQIRPRRDIHKTVGLEFKDVIPDSSMTAVGLLMTSHPASHARLDASNAWCVTYIQSPTYMQVDLLVSYDIAGIVSQGHSALSWTVDNFTLAMSHFGDVWHPYVENGETVVFRRGDAVRDVKVYHYLMNLAVYRYVRIHPDGNGKFCFRVDVLRHCPGCIVALNPEEWSNTIFSTSFDGPTIQPHYEGASSWCSPGVGTYLQVRFPYAIRISRIDLRADDDSMRIDEMKLSYSLGGDEFVSYLNESDPRSVLRWPDKALPIAQFYTDEKIVCSVLRLVVRSTVGSPCLRIQIYKSTDGGRHDVGVADPTRVPVDTLTDNGGRDHRTARLHGNQGWYMTNNNPFGKYLQIDIAKPRVIVAIATQGHGSNAIYVTPSYQLSTKMYANSPSFTFYQENGENKNFAGNFDSSSVVYNEIDRHLIASVIQFHVTKTDVGLRIELFYALSGYPPSCSSTITRHSGQTVIDPDGLGPIAVLCDRNPDQGGYNVIQRRFDGSVNFNRDFAAYERGFGDLNGEFWLGNDIISRLVSIPSELLVELWSDTSLYTYATYSQIQLKKHVAYAATFKYDESRSTAPNRLHVGLPVRFSTSDTPGNDGYHTNCDGKVVYDSGWWRLLPGCSSDLNAPFGHSSFRWKSTEQLRRTELKIKPREVSRRAARVVSIGYKRDIDAEEDRHDNFRREKNFAIVKQDHLLLVSMNLMGQRWQAELIATPEWGYYQVAWNSVDGFLLEDRSTEQGAVKETVSRLFSSETYERMDMRITFGDDESYHMTNLFRVRISPLETVARDKRLRCGFDPFGCLWLANKQSSDVEPKWSSAMTQSVSGNLSFAAHRSADVLYLNGYFGILDGTSLPDVSRTLRTRYLLPVFGCVSFWLYMVGNADPVFAVEKLSLNGSSSVMFQQKGSVDESWRMIQLPLPTDLDEPYQLLFVGHIDTFYADILIDSIEMMTSSCPDVTSAETFNCAFDGAYDFATASCHCPLFIGKPWLLDAHCKRKLTTVYDDAANYYAFNTSVIYDLLTEKVIVPLGRLTADSSLVYASMTSYEHAQIVPAPLCFSDPGKCGHAVAISFWLKVSQLRKDIFNEMPLFGSAFFSKGVVVSLMEGGTARVSVITYSKLIHYDLPQIEAASWHYIVIRWDGAIQDMDAFLDGHLVPATQKSVDTTKTLKESGNVFSLYQYTNSSVMTSIDELSLWSHKLPSDVIKDIFQLSRGFGTDKPAYDDIQPIIHIPVSVMVTKPAANDIRKEESYNLKSEQISILIRDANITSFREIDRFSDLSSYYSLDDAFTYRIYFDQLTLFDHISLAVIESGERDISFDFLHLYRDYFAREELLKSVVPFSDACTFSFSLDRSSKSLVHLIKIVVMSPIWNVTHVVRCPLINSLARCSAEGLSAFTDYSYWVFVSVAGIEVPVAAPETFKTKKSVPNSVPGINTTNVSTWSMSLAWSIPLQSAAQDELSSFFLSVALSDFPLNDVFNVSLEPTDTTQTIENLLPFTSYVISIVAINAIGSSRPTMATVLTGDAAPNDIPLLFRAVNVTHNSAIVAWQPISRSQQRSAVVWYDISYWSVVTIGNQSHTSDHAVISTDLFATEYTLTDLKSLQQYDLTIEAVNSKGSGGKAQLSIETTEGELDIPPANLRMTNLSRTSFLVNWTAISPHDHSSILLGYSLVYFSNRYSLPIVHEIILANNVTSIVIRGLEQFTNYSVGVRGRAALGEGPTTWSSLKTDGFSDVGYDSWGAWGECSTTCDTGLQQRHRKCLIQKCLAADNEQRKCIEMKCPIHGEWSLWGEWSPCSKSCLGGVQFRNRDCTNPMPEFGGRPCEGVLEESASCNLKLCPIDGAWSEWTPFMVCNRPCNGGLRIKRRYCVNPKPQFDGKACEGANEATSICNTRPCQDKPSIEIKARFVDENFDENYFNQQNDRTQAFALRVDQDVRAMYSDSSVVDVLVHNLEPGSVIANITVELRQSKYLEILTLQDSIATRGQLHSMPVQALKIWSADLPALPPRNVRVVSRSGTSVKLAWDTVPTYATNGNIDGYTVFFKETIPDSAPWSSESVANTSLSLDVTHLKLFTLYSFRVAAFLVVGNGITSDELLEWTKEMPPSAAPNITIVEAINASTLYIQWDAIPIDNHNGILRNYFLRYANVNTAVQIANIQWRELTYDISETRTHLYGLLPFTKYVVEIAGVTGGAGAGVTGRKYIEMPEGAPLVAPTTVSVQSWYSTDTIMVRWNEPDLSKMQGVLIGFEIHYCLIRVGSTEYPDPLCRMVLAGRYASSIVISGLHMYGVFSVQVKAYTAGGTGPGSEPAFGETCRCRRRIFTLWKTHPAFVQFDGERPYGLFPDLVEEFITKACGVCLAHGKSEVRFLGTYSGRNPRRYSDEALQNDIGSDHSSVGFPYFGRAYIDTVLGEISFIPIIVSSGAAIITIKDDFPDVTQMIVAIFRAWTLILVMLLSTYLAAIIFWMVDQHGNEDLHPGDLWNGLGIALWWAYTTMTTVGYGEIFPRTVIGRLYSIVWILVGLLLVAFLTGHISNVLTTQATTSNVKLYGTKVSVLNGSFEQEFALKRNAKLDRHLLYLNAKEVFKAVEDRVVEAAFVDTLDAGADAKYLDTAPLKVESIVDTQTAFGVLLANELRYIDADVKQLVSINSNRIRAMVEARVTKIQAEQDSQPSAQDSVVVSAKAPSFKTFIIVVIVMAVVIALLGIACTYLRDGGNNKIAVKSEAASRVLQNTLRTELTAFVDKFHQTIDRLDKKHVAERRRILSADGYTFYKYIIPKRKKKSQKVFPLVPAKERVITELQATNGHPMSDDVDGGDNPAGVNYDYLDQYSSLPSMHSEVAELQGSLLTIPAVSEDSDDDENYSHDYDNVIATQINNNPRM